MARPRKDISIPTIQHLALYGCTLRSMAREVGVSEDTLARRVKDTQDVREAWWVARMQRLLMKIGHL